MEGGALNVKWKSHSSNLYTQLDCLYYDQNLVDVTLSCNDGIIKAHRLVLSVCSPYFESLFKDNQHRHPIVILKGVSRCELENVITFMYKGSVKVLQNEFESFMILASELKVRGLSEEPDFKQKILTSDCIQHDTLEGISSEPVKQPEKIVKKRGRPRKHNIPTEGVEQSKSMINTNNRRSNTEAHSMITSLDKTEIVTADPLLKDNMDEFWDSIKKEIETEPEDQSCSSNKATFSEDGKDMSIASPEERTSPELNSHSFNTRFKGQKRVNVGTRALSLGSIKRKDTSIKKRRVRYSSSNDGLYSSDANSSRQAPPSEDLTHEVTPDLHWHVVIPLTGTSGVTGGLVGRSPVSGRRWLSGVDLAGPVDVGREGRWGRKQIGQSPGNTKSRWEVRICPGNTESRWEAGEQSRQHRVAVGGRITIPATRSRGGRSGIVVGG
uniref:BTB domain-containing protein n=1 Tax=Timema cristinae TaxID=61476 RepID=A0A7R9H1E3_TIMCR|nr:unnamed protein product [Timema cristinae]